MDTKKLNPLEEITALVYEQSLAVESIDSVCVEGKPNTAKAILEEKSSSIYPTTITVGDAGDLSNVHARKVFIQKNIEGDFPIFDKTGLAGGFLCKTPEGEDTLPSGYVLITGEEKFKRFTELRNILTK